jgi:asparagine synthase (glutamine-hydrolysing)
MASHSGRYVITFNGEIYNYRSIQDELSQRGELKLTSTSDTEILLLAIEAWGIEKTLRKINGMLAFALWDKEKKVLTLATDRLGKKPLYYGWIGKTFVFGSELKALLAFPHGKKTLNRNALSDYFRLGYIPAPHTVFEEFKKLSPAHFLNVKIETSQNQEQPCPYWKVADLLDLSIKNQSEKAWLDEIEEVLSDATRLRMISDVPLGAFLSSGIDSALVVAQMQKQSSKKIKTFTIGFTEKSYDESEQARLIARHFGTAHSELKITSDEAIEIIPHISQTYDEPFADSSHIPTYLVSRLARENVTVALSGDGGDELFGGYNRYLWGHGPLNLFFKGPKALTLPLIQTIKTLFPSSQKISRLASAVQAGHPDFYLNLISHWSNPDELFIEKPSLKKSRDFPVIPDLTRLMMFQDLSTYLPGDILTKLDRASMRVSLEARCPFLDPRMVELAWQMPPSLKIQNGKTKYLLRKLLERHLPGEITQLPKRGFSIPLGEWLRGKLKPWANDLLSEKKLLADGILNPTPIRKRWEEHQSGKANWEQSLWNVLVYQSWQSWQNGNDSAR